MGEREVHLEELERERLLRLRAELELAEVLLQRAQERRESAARRLEDLLGETCQARGLNGRIELHLERGTLVCVEEE